MASDVVQDVDGNIIGCRYCGSRSIRKHGYLYRAKSKRQQWMCNSCGKRTVNPSILEKAEFVKEITDPDYIPIEELIEHRKRKYSVKVKGKESRRLINIDIKTKGNPRRVDT